MKGGRPNPQTLSKSNHFDFQRTSSHIRIYFATDYIQYPNCKPPEFTPALATCGGTRDGYANWGTSVNYVVP